MLKKLCFFTILCLLLVTLQVNAFAAGNPYPRYNWYNDESSYQISCTSYAWDQAYSRLGIELPKWGDAGDWYGGAQSSYHAGDLPMAESIACWSKANSPANGHVAYVTGVNANGAINIREGGSKWSGNDHGVLARTINPGTYWPDQGFIYLSSSPTPNKPTVNTAVHSTKVNISWNAVGATSYYVYVQVLKGQTWETAWEGANVGINHSCECEFAPGKYKAVVSAVYWDGIIKASTSDFSIVEKTAPTVNTTVNGTKVNISWKSVSAASYYVYVNIYRNQKWETAWEGANVGTKLNCECEFSPGRYQAVVTAVYGENDMKSGVSEFTIPSSQLETYPITYNANGGSGAPASQTKTQGVDLTLSSTIPTRGKEELSSYTVTLDANGGSVNPTTLTATTTNIYAFLTWSTEADGGGTLYKAGDSYTADAPATLYAQWAQTTNIGVVELPTPTRDGYSFVAWGTSPTATDGAVEAYYPSADVTLYAIWAENEPQPTERFSDVTNPKLYYYTPVYWAADNNITKGYPDGSFGVGKECQRRELLIFMWRYMGSPTGYGDARTMFNDMGAYNASSAANKAVAWAYKTGIVKGYADGGIHPTEPIVRKDVMIMLYRMAGKPAVSGTLSFKDCQSFNRNSDTYKAILWGSQKGITKGYSSGPYKGQFGVGLDCLREQIVTFLYRYNNLE